MSRHVELYIKLLAFLTLNLTFTHSIFVAQEALKCGILTRRINQFLYNKFSPTETALTVVPVLELTRNL